MNWRIYYGDGSTFSSDDGAWEDAPGWDVQVILFRDPIVGWAIRHQGDFFRLDDDGTVVCMDMTGLLDWAVNELGMKAGRMLSRDKFGAVYQRAKRDMLELQA
jgi:hypothetical protein